MNYLMFQGSLYTTLNILNIINYITQLIKICIFWKFLLKLYIFNNFISSLRILYSMFWSYSPPFPKPPRLPLLQSIKFCVFFLICQVQFLLLIYSWMWDIPLELVQPIRSHTHKENEFSLSHLLLTVNPYLGVWLYAHVCNSLDLALLQVEQVLGILS